MDGAEIISVVNCIAILSDLRDWVAVQQCFTDQVAVDYTSLTGGNHANDCQTQRSYHRNF
jgi:hypothetical protein